MLFVCALQSCGSVLQVARLCEAHDVGHVINNAYGVQATALCKLARPCSISGLGSYLHLPERVPDCAVWLHYVIQCWTTRLKRTLHAALQLHDSMPGATLHFMWVLP